MKKLFAVVLLLGALAPAHAAFPIFGTVQASTDTTYAPTLQPGAFNISSGTVVNLNVSTVSATNVSASSMTVSTVTVTNLNVTSSATVTGPLTVISSTTLRGSVGILGNVNQPLTITSSMTATGNAEIDGVFKATGTVTLGSAGNTVTISSNAVLPGTTFYSPGATASVVTDTATITQITSTRVIVTTLTPTNIVGTTTNDNAAVGNYGQFMSSLTASGVATSGSNGAWSDFGSITLTAGDWDISLICLMSRNGATYSGVQSCGIGTAAGNSSTGIVDGDNQAYSPQDNTSSITTVTIPAWRASISGSTTYFGKVFSQFSVGTSKAYGRISARRVR